MHPGKQNLLRLQSFRDDLLPIAQYAYRMDRGKADDFGKSMSTACLKLPHCPMDASS